MQAEVIAFATKGRRDVQTTRKALNLEFVLVPGPNVDIMKQYGAYNYQTQEALPVTLIIDKAGIVRWKYIGKNVYDRPGRAAILAQLQLLR